jgi:hypothetical protein
LDVHRHDFDRYTDAPRCRFLSLLRVRQHERRRARQHDGDEQGDVTSIGSHDTRKKW